MACNLSISEAEPGELAAIQAQLEATQQELISRKKRGGREMRGEAVREKERKRGRRKKRRENKRKTNPGSHQRSCPRYSPPTLHGSTPTPPRCVKAAGGAPPAGPDPRRGSAPSLAHLRAPRSRPTYVRRAVRPAVWW